MKAEIFIRKTCLYTKIAIWVNKEMVDMSKMFGTRERSDPAKGGLAKLVRLFRRVDFDVSTPDANGNQRQLNPLNPQAFIIGKRRMHEIEKTKAMIMIESRHQSWKSGGPL